jgi:Arc/MetJ-type ribon-helix-helix transcriptional regulator
MKKTEKLTIRIPRELQERLEEEAYRRDITISELIRENLSEYLQSRYFDLEQEKITVRLPSDHLRKLKVLVDCGDSFSVENAIQVAVRNYILRRLPEITREGELLRSIYEQKGIVEKAQESTKQKLRK